MQRHDHQDAALPGNAAELARAWLDANQLQSVKVEITDLGDHYDPKARAVRLNRDRYERKSLTAITTAAHEVSHALQDADDYAPFVWRTQLAGLARALGQVGTVILLTVPAAALFSRRPIPPWLIGSTLLLMLGSGLAWQLVSLQSELDASFKRAVPILQNGVVGAGQLRDARQILLACSLTYVASPLLSVLNIWPWLGSGLGLQAVPPRRMALGAPPRLRTGRVRKILEDDGRIRRSRSRDRPAEKFLRLIGKPLIRGLFRLRSQIV